MAEDKKPDPVMSSEDVAGDSFSTGADTPVSPTGEPGSAIGMSPDQVAQAQFQLQKVYAKDISFEVPNGPAVFREQGQADVKMSLSQRVEALEDDMHEVVLTVTITATIGEKTAYLAEVAQCGIFLMSGFPSITLQPVNFEQLYARRMQEIAAEQGNGSGGNGAGGSNQAPPQFSTDS